MQICNDILFFSQTKKNYKWAEPKTCRDDLPSSVALPVSGQPEQCPPCNPGMQKGPRGCEFCQSDEFSDGKDKCEKCPGSTAPQRGLYLQWWNNIPFNSNISVECVSVFGKFEFNNTVNIVAGLALC